MLRLLTTLSLVVAIVVATSAQVRLNIRIVPAPPAPPPPGSVKPPLGESDFTYLGYYDVQLSGNDSFWGQTFTHRYVSGQLRFLTLQSVWSQLQEFTVAGLSYGQTVTTPTRRYDFSGTNWSHLGIWWDASGNRLWTTSAEDYTTTDHPTYIYTRQLNDNGDNGTYTDLTGYMDLTGINAKRVYGGALAFPTWFQTAAGCGPYGVGFGGYTSLLNQGGGASIGPTLYCVPSPITGTTSSYKSLVDFAGARGIRATQPVNYFDSGDPRQNPTSRPTDPPLANAGYLSPNDDIAEGPLGVNFQVWGDSYYNTGMWIETATKASFVAVLSACKGYCWYMNSTLNYDDRQFEIHIFDPQDLIDSANGMVSPDEVYPSTMFEIDPPHTIASPAWGGNMAGGNIAGATYDPTTGLMFAYGVGLGATIQINRVFVYQVAQ